ncbi:hypothetical protein [Vibrio jasicida]|uniref:hypothetical protein n=1 Tax=Vibrio jasicida TaxID=766224 RepID=UPI0015E3D6CF|nr:hypothetical protein [Vibrio jasicida]
MYLKFIAGILACVISNSVHAEKHKDFGDYTTYVITQSNGVIYKQANVKLSGMLAELEFHSRSNDNKVFAFVNKQSVKLIVDGNIMDNELEINEVEMVKNAHDLAVIHGNRTYLVSTKGSGASMIYITDFPSNSNSISTDDLNKKKLMMDNLAYISEAEAYSRFNDEWKKVCRTERSGYEKWRLTNIKPVLDEFKRISKGMDFGSVEWKAQNNANQKKIKQLVGSSSEWKEVLACEEAHLNTKGFTQQRS